MQPLMRRVVYDFPGKRRLIVERVGKRYRASILERKRWLVFWSWTSVAATSLEAENDEEAVERALDWARKLLGAR